MVEDSIFDDLDRTCFNISSNLASIFSNTYEKVFCRLWAPLDPNKFDNSTNKVKEIAIRTFIAIGLLATVLFTGLYISIPLIALAVGSKIFKAAGFYLQKEGFTHIKGKASETEILNGQASVMTWNICGYGGGLHYDQGGVVHWRSRIDRIVENIEKESPDILVLEAVYDTALVEALVEKLGNNYAHFYTHLGKNAFGNGSGLMVITKCAVHQFTHTDFTGNDSKNTRGFSTLEIKASSEDQSPILRIIGTELTSKADARERRIEELSQIIDRLARQKIAMPTLLVGSLHMDRDGKAEGKYLGGFLYHSHLSGEKTQTDELRDQWAHIAGKKELSSDFISLCKRKIDDGRTLPAIEKGLRLNDSHVIKGFDESYRTDTSISPHHGIMSTISGLKKLAS